MGEAKKRGDYISRKHQAEMKKLDEELKQKELTKQLQSFVKSRMPKPLNLNHFIESIKSSLESKNYFAALLLSLTLPDICCSLEAANRRSTGEKYAAWFLKFVQSKYTTNKGENSETVFLCGHECYALRCSFLHKGYNQIIHEQILNDIDKKSHKIEFMAEMQSDKIIVDEVLLLKLETFCENIIDGVNQWTKLAIKNPMIVNRLRESPEIYTDGFSPATGIYIGG